MGKKHRTAARRERTDPALSALDKAVHAVLELLICAAIPGFLMVLAMNVEDSLAETPHVLAARMTWGRLPFIGSVLLAFGSILYTQGFLLDGQPLFGRSDIRYDRQTDPSLYPLFWRVRRLPPPNGAARREHARLRKRALWFLAVYGASILLILLTIVPHHTVYEDESLREYGSFGQVVRSYGPEEYGEVYIETYENSTSPHSSHWDIRVSLKTADGRVYEFTVVNHCLSLLDLVKALPPEHVHISGKETLPDVLDYYRFTEAEIRTANALFGLTG